jgi:starch synthase
VTQAEPIRVLLASPEVVGFAKTGGLADVAGSLPSALARRGHQVAVILPLYRAARAATPTPEPTPHTFTVPVGARAVPGRLWRSSLPGGVPVYLVEQDDYFGRDDPAAGKGLYQQTLPDGTKKDYPDNCERFVFFNRAVLEVPRRLGFWPDVLHLNDWQTGLVPVYLKEHYSAFRPSGLPYDRIRTLLTIHNVAFQGVFWHWDMDLAGLDWRLFNPEQLEYHGRLSFLKAGAVFADLLNTVSPTYAREIQTPYYGCGLEGVLSGRRDRLFGIVNGVDYDVWKTTGNPHLPASYSVDRLEPGKPACKAELQRSQGLAVDPRAPLLGVVARLTEQKGVHLIAEAAPALVEQDGAQLVVLGDGEPKYQKMFKDLKATYPGRVGLKLGLDEALAHLIEAGSDAFLMPSLFEPCGLNQMYSLRYGTPPVVRATGGLADTVVDATPAALAAGTATGFAFVAQTADALLGAVRRALTLCSTQPGRWRQLLATGMRQDWSWDRSAGEYEALYRKLRATV